MKTISTFITACLLMLSVAATAREPQVSVYIDRNGNTDYDISIDGKYYSDNQTNIGNLGRGTHTVQVYRVTSSGVFGLGKKRELLGSRQFRLSDYDMRIDVDRNGRLSFNEVGNNNNNDNGWNNNRNNNNRDNNNGSCSNHRHKNDNWKNGRGNKYGHYKKQKHHNDDDDNAWGKNKKYKDFDDDNDE